LKVYPQPESEQKRESESFINFMVPETVLLVNLPIFIFLHQADDIGVPVLNFGQFELFLVETGVVLIGF
jgi:hypothetical protein